MYRYTILKDEFNNCDLDINDVHVRIEQTHDNDAKSVGKIYDTAGSYYMYTFEKHIPAFFIAKLADYFGKAVDRYTNLESRADDLLRDLLNNKPLQANEESEDIER